MSPLVTALDIVIATGILVITIHYLNWMDAVGNGVLVSFLNRHSSWYFPTIVGTIGVFASILLNFNLMYGGAAVWLCGLWLVFVQRRFWIQGR